MDFCCKKMADILEEDHSISYQRRTRTYSASTNRSFVHEDNNEITLDVVDTIYYCPWCGKKLPQDLWDAWHDEIEMLGFELPLQPDDYKKIPNEFMTEEWWRKRGL